MKRIISTIDIGSEFKNSSIDYRPLNQSKNLYFQLLQLLYECSEYDVILLNVPSNVEMIFSFFAKTIYSHRLKIVVIDLILRKPFDKKSLLISKIKSFLVKSFDLILMYSQDTSGYEKYYGISKEKFYYVPFKPNNLAMVDKVTSIEGDYIVSLGTSHRDYMLLLDALASLKLKTKIVASSIGIEKNNANIKNTALPFFVEHLSNKVSAENWNTLIAQSKFVVIPIIKGTIQPAGVSVYLEAMAIGKAVVVTKGASTNGILNESLAELVDEGDVSSMSIAIKKIWYNDDRRKQLERNGKAYAAGLEGHDRLMRDIRIILDNV